MEKKKTTTANMILEDIPDDTRTCPNFHTNVIHRTSYPGVNYSAVPLAPTP